MIWFYALGAGAAGFLGWEWWTNKNPPSPKVPLPTFLVDKPEAPGALSTIKVTKDGINVVEPIIMPPPQTIGTTPKGNTITSLTPTNPDTGKATVSHEVATGGIAKDAAHELYDYLVAHGADGSPTLATLVRQFQTQSNADPKSVRLVGKIDVNGLYNLQTSAALTVYTGNPIAPDPKEAALPFGKVADPNSPNAAAMSASNLYAYLKLHKNDKTSTLKALVKQFQHDVNTDPKFPGPAMPFPTARVVRNKLAEDGLYGPSTADALATTSFERIAP